MGESGTRQRLAAILAADAAGYSRLMGADEHATVAALDAGRAIFRRHIDANRGRVVDTAGDSVLAVFESAVGAVSAALAIQQEITGSLRFRIGIHLGDIIEKPDGTVYGNGVNIASRLQALADPAGIVISDAVRASVKQPVADLGPQTVKNIAEPIRAFALNQGQTPFTRPRRWKTWSVPVFGVGVMLAAAGAWYAMKVAGTPTVEGKSIAVLPFANMSDDKDTAYFADGVHEDLLTQLALLGDMKVVSRTSVMDYRNTKKNARQIAAELGVVSLVEGSVRRAGGQIRVTAQLIDARSDKHLWAKSYDRELKDIFAIQSELATEIARSLKVSLDPQDQARLARKPTDNMQAYELFLREKELERQVTASARMWTTLNERIDMLSKAVELDPRFALAWARLAAQHARAYAGGLDRTAARLDRARQASERALALAPQDLLVKLEIGNYHADALDDVPGAAKAFEEVLADAPGSVDAMLALARIRTRQLKWGERAALLERALALDPRNAATLSSLAWQYREFRQFDRALALHRQLLELRPGDRPLQARLHWMEYWRTGSWAAYDEWRASLPGDAATRYSIVRFLDSARALLRRDFGTALRLVDVVPEDTKGLFDSAARAEREVERAMFMFAKGGAAEARPAARAALRVLEAELKKAPDVSGFMMEKAHMHAILGERGPAFASLARAAALDRGRGNMLYAEQTERESLRLHAMLGERTKALEQVRQQLRMPAAMPHEMRYDPALAALWDDPEFVRLVNDPANNAPIGFDVRYAASVLGK